MSDSKTISDSPPPQLINIFRVAIILKLVGALVGIISSYLLIQQLVFDRWSSAVVSSILLLLLLTPWRRSSADQQDKKATITHRQLMVTLALAIFAPQIELVHSSQVQWLSSHTLFITKLGWSQEQINNIHALSGLFTMVPVVLASWQYGRRGMCLSLAWAGLLYIITPLALPADAFTWRLYMIRGFVLLGVTLILAITTYILVQAQKREQAALEVANQQLGQQAAMIEQLAIHHERNRLARELHDTLAHSLSATAVQLQAIEVLLRVNPPAAATEVKSAQKQIRHGLQEARRAITALRASPLEELGLAEALRQQALQVSERVGIPIDCTINQPSYKLPLLTEQTIYRVAEEGLLNAEKHAQASQLTLSLKKCANHLQLTISDNGVGFDRHISQQHGHFGLLGMAERAKLIGATLTIESTTGQGTTIHLSAPLFRPPTEAT